MYVMRNSHAIHTSIYVQTEIDILSVREEPFKQHSHLLSKKKAAGNSDASCVSSKAQFMWFISLD